MRRHSSGTLSGTRAILRQPIVLLRRKTIKGETISQCLFHTVSSSFLFGEPYSLQPSTATHSSITVIASVAQTITAFLASPVALTAMEFAASRNINKQQQRKESVGFEPKIQSAPSCEMRMVKHHSEASTIRETDY